jgi:hypothetical protein
MQRNVKFIDKYELEDLRNKLIAKLFRDLGKKYKTILLDKDITIEKFTKDFEKEIQKNFDFSNPDYRKFFHESEKLILEKLSKLPDKRRENMKQKQEIDNKLLNVEVDKEEYFLYPERVKNNRIRKEVDKQSNEWAKMANYEYEQFVSETHKKAIEERIRKQLLNEELGKQICEKREKEVNAKAEEVYFGDVLKKTMENMDIQEREKNLKAKEMFLKQKELLLSSMEGNDVFYLDSLHNKRENLRIEKELDQKILQQIAKEEADRKIEHDRKREEFRQQQIEVKRTNDEKLREKRENQLKEKIIDKKLINDYTKILERQEIENRKKLNSIAYFSNYEDEKEKQLELEKKYFKELLEIERK